MLKRLDHPNVVKFHNALKSRNNLYVILELCDMGDLQGFLKRGKTKLTEKEAKFVMQQMVAAFSYLTSKRIMHRDLKLANILMKKKREVGEWQGSLFECDFKLADLGMAKYVTRNSELASTYCGTPMYMAPEIMQGKNYDYKVDIWSLGTTLFQLLTGQFPFSGTTMDELKRNIHNGAYQIPQSVEISFLCLDFLNSCLRFDKHKRKDWASLVNHPFLQEQPQWTFDSKSLLNETQNIVNQTIALNTRNSFNFHEVYSKVLLKKIDKRLDRARQRFALVSPAMPIK